MSGVLDALDALFPRFRQVVAGVLLVVALWAFGHAFGLEFRINRRP